MPRPRDEFSWSHVLRVAHGKHWVCRYCGVTRSGTVGRVKAHLAKCPKFSDNATQVNNDIAPRVEVNPQAKDLHLEMNRLKQVVHELERGGEHDIIMLKARGKKCKPDVDDWLAELQELKAIAKSLDDSTEVYEITELINQMKRHQKESPVTLSTEFSGDSLDMHAHEILRLLADDTVFVIGILGMGGVGKTLLASLVENVVKRRGSFKNVFWVTVSPNFSISNLQSDIAKRIGLKLDEEDEKIRAEKLSSALEKEEAVIILDDVWKYINLDKVGIHPRVNGLKVILTTRLKHLCQQMNCLPDHIITIIPLSCCKLKGGDEDWKLFTLELGHCGTPMTLPLEIKLIAKCIVKRCEGLPLGICVMARTMRGIDDIHQWRHTFNKQKELEMGQEMVEEVFKVLVRSYDNLMESNLQGCFLYCTLLSTTYKCDKDELIMRLVDKGLINGTRCLKDIFDEGNTVLNKLESHFLLSSHGYYAFTHRLVLDMACFIMKGIQKNVLVKLEKDLTNIALTHEWAADLHLVHLWNCGLKEIPEGVSPNCNKLSMLIMNQLQFSHVPECFFKYMNSILVLDLSYNKDLVSLPKSLSNLKSLISLILKGCASLNYVPPLGDLQALSRLEIAGSLIEEAPEGLEKLINLKWLDLSRNSSLNLELGSFLSNLIKLQYLNLLGISAMITMEEVQGMKMLECFGGVFDCKHYHAQNMVNMINGLNTYHLIFGKALSNERDLNSIVPGYSCNKTLQFGDCDQSFHTLPKDLTCLNIDANNNLVCLCNAFWYNSSSSLTRIGLRNCLQLNGLFCLSGSCSFCTNIHNLQVLTIRNLASLIDVCTNNGVGIQSLSVRGIFSFLTEFNITECHLIKRLLPQQLVQQLQNLEKLSVRDCDSMLVIFEGNNIALPKLISLTLSGLPQLNKVSEGSLFCESKPYTSINSCPKLRQPSIEIVEIPEL